MVKRKKQFKIYVFRFPKKKFEKLYGKGTMGVSPRVNVKTKEGEIHIRKDGQIPKKKFEQTLKHEEGHIVSEKCQLYQNLSDRERKMFAQFGKGYVSLKRGRHIKRGELIKEGLAGMYEKIHLGTQSEKEIIKKYYKSGYQLLRECKRKLNPKVILNQV